MTHHHAAQRKVRKAVIPAAGFGTRMLPATKSIPKEMLTIVDRPIIDYIAEEAFASGIEHIVIVLGRMKSAIEDYFDRAVELDAALRSSGKQVLADHLQDAVPLAGAVSFVRQQEARGLGHAIWTARHVVGEEPFAVLLPDMLMTGEIPCLKGLLDIHARHGGNVIAVQQCRPEETSKFGIVSLSGSADDPLIQGMVEKPAPEDAPSNLYICGRYVLDYAIFSLLEDQPPGAGGEIQLTDAIARLMKNQAVRPYEFGGRIFDCGNPGGFIAANMHMGLAREDVAGAVASEMDALSAAARRARAAAA
jgi:UTP--glucose-1-phosphate uridylyltransferase